LLSQAIESKLKAACWGRGAFGKRQFFTNPLHPKLPCMGYTKHRTFKLGSAAGAHSALPAQTPMITLRIRALVYSGARSAEVGKPMTIGSLGDVSG
jgi:hypothetical protein